MAGSKFTEATRVQMPAMVHLTRLGYKYFGKISEESAGKFYDPQTNILHEVFQNQYEMTRPEIFLQLYLVFDSSE